VTEALGRRGRGIGETRLSEPKSIDQVRQRAQLIAQRMKSAYIRVG
jgi:hypothetical protein